MLESGCFTASIVILLKFVIGYTKFALMLQRYRFCALKPNVLAQKRVVIYKNDMKLTKFCKNTFMFRLYILPLAQNYNIVMFKK